MNRPKRKTYVKRYGWEHTERYIQALETYSHYLEKALDKACEKLAFVSDEHIIEELGSFTLGEINRTKEQWKEWCMQDYVTSEYEDEWGVVIKR